MASNSEEDSENLAEEINVIPVLDECLWKDIPLSSIDNYQARPLSFVRNKTTKHVLNTGSKKHRYAELELGGKAKIDKNPNDFTCAQLQKMAKDKGIPMRSGMKKAELCEKLGIELVKKIPNNGKNNTVNVMLAVMIALTFVKNDDPDNTEVDHIDENRRNNRADNLQWITHSDNVKKTVDFGRKDGKPGITPIKVTYPNGDYTLFKCQKDCNYELNLPNINVIRTV